jgi:hypothetical protein
MTTRLEELIAYGFPRAVGHTWTEVNGVKNNPKAVLIVAFEKQKDFIDLPKEQMISISNLEEKLAERRCPVVIDHFALSILVGECVRYYKGQIDMLIEQNNLFIEEKEDLKEKLHNFTK